MPFCPLNVRELPLLDPRTSPCVVDIEKYDEHRPQVYLDREYMAPLDAAVTFLYLTDGHILRFEHHHMETSSQKSYPPDGCSLRPLARLQYLNTLAELQIHVAVSIMELKGGIFSGMSGSGNFLFFGTKEDIPDGFIMCPRLESRGDDSLPLIEYWEQEYEDDHDTLTHDLKVSDARLLPLSRRCVCETPDSRRSINKMEQENVERKMKKFCKIRPYRNTVQYKE
ncbi:hypothetical protein NHQ30_001280 [Ciborinia camelliae]|nr:hypothetical protein NHQ30_001280 [Ciborinia camelliae]